MAAAAVSDVVHYPVIQQAASLQGTARSADTMDCSGGQGTCSIIFHAASVCLLPALLQRRQTVPVLAPRQNLS